MRSDKIYNSVKNLPYADHLFKATPKFIGPINFTLESDSSRTATLFTVYDAKDVPMNLIQVLEDEFNQVVEEGSKYPHHKPLHGDEFIRYWFTHCVGILIEGDYGSVIDVGELSIEQWHDKFLGTFFVKPNYIGRCSHICNGAFIVNHTKRRMGLGKELGKKYLWIASKLGYVYSVFKQVFETNLASVKLWDSLGFERIGYIKNAAVLKGHDRLVGIYMFGKDLQ